MITAVFSQARAVTNGEASLILERHLNHKREEDATYQPTSMLQKTLEYCQRFASVRNTSAHDDIRRYVCDCLVHDAQGLHA